MPRLRMCDAAVLVLRETDNPAVMSGDAGLLHAIATRAGAKCRGKSVWTEFAVIDTLSKTPGELVPALTQGAHGRTLRIFRLPEDTN